MLLKRLLLTSAFVLPLTNIPDAKAKKETSWSYTGSEGPQHWGEISPTFSACSAGKKQSPLNINSLGNESASPLLFSYHTIPLNIIDNGQTLKVNTAPGNSVFLNGEEYFLQQFHYHTPSEHHLQDKSFPMEIHFVHQNKAGDYLVVGVLVKEGAENSEYAKIIANQPSVEKTVFHHKDISINLKNLLNITTDHYDYQGSFTTPPCTEGVHWFVLKAPITLSKEQLNSLKAVHPHNNRPLQKRHGRKV